MTVRLYMDVHVPWPITEQLRRRAVDVLTAQDDEAAELSEEQLLARAAELGRLLFTQDIRFKTRAEDWQRAGRPFAGWAFGHQLRGTIGQYVANLELSAKATEPDEWRNRIEHLPF